MGEPTSALYSDRMVSLPNSGKFVVNNPFSVEAPDSLRLSLSLVLGGILATFHWNAGGTVSVRMHEVSGILQGEGASVAGQGPSAIYLISFNNVDKVR